MPKRTQTVELPAARARRRYGGHRLYRPGQQSECPYHSHCAYDGTERGRCRYCHAAKTVGCNHISHGGIPPNSSRASLCRGCDELFSSVSSFDKHQRVGVGCLDPESVGLELTERFGGWALWAFPGEPPPR